MASTIHGQSNGVVATFEVSKIMRCALILFVSLPIIWWFAVTGTAGDFSLRDESSTAEHESKIACLAERDISEALRKFELNDPANVDQARALLLNNSRRSPRCRKEVITSLMRAMDKPDLDFNSDPGGFHLWRYGADLLGDLKASEALDLLISHLNFTQRFFFSTSMSQQPALRGVIKMGPIAIPKLDSLLRHSPDPKLRHTAVYCIATIGGPSAVLSLKQALPLESDKCVSRFIRVSLDSFDDKGNIKNRLEWFSGFACNE